MIDFFDLTYEKTEEIIKKLGEKSFRAKQLFDWVYKKRVYDFNEMTDLSLALREKLSNSLSLKLPNITSVVESSEDKTKKYLIALSDGNIIECVLMRYSHGNSLCISSQVGCRMGCKFCASAELGLVRDLTQGEFITQILTIEKEEEVKISNIVVMGIGEPLDNIDNLVGFIKTANDKRGLEIGIRNFTISTCGIADKIIELADIGLGINLALSLHTPDDAKRKTMMPIANKFDISSTIDAMQYFTKKTGRRPTYEYTLISGFNDSVRDANELTNLIKGTIAHVNIIILNETDNNDYKRPSKQAVDEFIKVLNMNGIEVTIRRRLGNDIQAACGQLRRSKIEK